MSDTAIRITDLSKSYSIRHETGQRATNLGEAIAGKLRKPFQRAETEEFWALKDINLEIKKGEVVGVIGRNGAGKSTLLKVLSRITEPTTGKIELFGRVGSLLEVGTGFHPELSGRENVYLNGAILGMRRPEIKKQFDAIIDFAGVEKFLDTPVKRYSSGMYVRLAFAVAAHLNPEILIVDEVLAVGDAEFQKKCLGKMRDVAQSGRTVLLVSHNMSAIEDLCSSATCLHNGSVSLHADTRAAIQDYNNKGYSLSKALNLLERKDRSGLGDIKLAKIEGGRDSNNAIIYLVVGSPAQLDFVFDKAVKHEHDLMVSFTIYHQQGYPLCHATSRLAFAEERGKMREEVKRVVWSTHAFPLAPGSYSLNVAVHLRGEMQDRVEGAVAIEVGPGLYSGRSYASPSSYNSFAIDHEWQFLPSDEISA